MVALDRRTNTKFAIKKFLNTFDDLFDAKRIHREKKLLGFLDHENLITLMEVLSLLA
jgi:mitogen-activated protein kinase 1/3